MKNLLITDETYTGICTVLANAIHGQDHAVDFLISRAGLDSNMTRDEIAELQALKQLQAVFLAAGGAPLLEPSNCL